MTEAGARLRELLGGARYAKLFAAVRDRLESAGEAARTVTVADLTSEERRAVAEVLGWRARGAGSRGGLKGAGAPAR